MRLGKKDAHFVRCFLKLQILDVHVVALALEQNQEIRNIHGTNFSR